jgi:phage tail-like protein
MSEQSYYPLPVYNFRVEIEGDSTPIGFSEVSGLAIEHDTMSYQESYSGGGRMGTTSVHMLGQSKPSEITMKKGFASPNSMKVLHDWLNEAKSYKPVKKDITVSMCDENGSPVLRWKIVGAFPKKLEIPGFDAKSNDVAVGTLNLMADEVKLLA